ncbi:MAG: portal protein [Candidatus Thiodiazotropha lotti]|nr:portal protein [Candidatus Thiodiazotropha lotti]
MKMDVDLLKKHVNHLFERQRVMLPLWQTLAENFYPERADFTITRNVGMELADNLVDSYPVLVRRDLGNSFSAMLRDGQWFEMDITGEADHAGKQWLEWGSKRMLQIMYRRNSNFVRTTKEADHDYATFGQPVISVERNRKADGLLYRNWHLRDCAWFDDENGQVGGVARRWKPTRRELVSYFGRDNVDPKILEDLKEKPFEEIECYHITMPSDMFGDDEIQDKGFPFVSIFLDMKHEKIMEETGVNNHMYVIPRFQTIAGSPYAFSPAAITGLPNSRTIQAMTHTLLEAGERYARPPLVANEKVIRGDIDLLGDGITYLDPEYDERFGEAIRPLYQNQGGFPIGLELRQGVVEILSSAFYRDKLSLPEVSHEMTAYEVSERMKQFRRENLPLFAPIESEYNGQLCEISFELAMQNGFLGSPYDIPESLRDRDVKFKFKSPLTEAEEEAKVNQFAQVADMLAKAAQVDEGAVLNVDIDESFRDAVAGTGAPTKWLRDIKEVAMAKEQMSRQMAEQQAAEQMNV